MPKKSHNKLELLQERASSYIQEDAKLMQKYKIAKKIVVFFPFHKKPPFLGRIALKLLSWSKGEIDIRFISTE